MKIKKKIIFFLALISMFYCVSLVQSTYAKYITSANAEAGLTIARWSILVNSKDVMTNSDFSSNISPIFTGNANIKDDVIAPTAQGYFDIVINGENTDVSFQYTINLDYALDNNVNDLKITKYTMNNTDYTYNLGNDITGYVINNDLDKTRTIRFYVEWVEGDGETMNNEADTQATRGGNASFSANVNLIQLH